jgi:hypothetical protein
VTDHENMHRDHLSQRIFTADLVPALQKHCEKKFSKDATPLNGGFRDAFEASTRDQI